MWPKRTQQVRSFLIFRKGNHPGFGEKRGRPCRSPAEEEEDASTAAEVVSKGDGSFPSEHLMLQGNYVGGPKKNTRMIQVDPTLGYVSQCFVPSKIASCSILQLTKKTRRFHFVHWLLIQGFLPQESEW